MKNMLRPYFPRLVSFVRKYSISFAHENVEQKLKHPFKHIVSKQDVIKYLLNNVIYEDDNIVVFNKPAGIGKSPPAQLEKVERLIPNVYMENVLSDIEKVEPKYANLNIVKFPEKYTSGVMILATSNAAKLQIEKCKRRVSGNDEFSDSYLVISLGHPISHKNSCKLGIRLRESEENKRKVPILEEQWSKGDMKKQRLKLFRVSHSVVSKGPLASLTRVSVSKNASNALRLYFATKLLSPILGDNIFSSRVKDLMGVPMLLDPWSDVANSPKRLHPELLRALSLSPNESSLVPLCVHLEKVELPGYMKGQDLLLRAPIPSSFSWVCQQLGLQEPSPPRLTKASDET